MSSEEKMEHSTLDRVETNASMVNGSPLGKQVTVSMSPEQYERMFLQPAAPKGDLRKRLGKSLSKGISRLEGN